MPLADAIILNQEYSFSSYNYPNYYIRHRDYLGVLTEVSSELDKKDSTFRVVKGLHDTGNPESISFESVNFPGYYLRHSNFRIRLDKDDGSKLFLEDATFNVEQGICIDEPGMYDYVSFRSANYPSRFIRHKDFKLFLEAGDDQLFKKDATFKVDTPNA